MDKLPKKFNRRYVDSESLDYYIAPIYTDDVQEITLTFIQTQGKCRANIVINPQPNTKSKIKIYIYAEQQSEVDCICELWVAPDVSGVETDIQIRSWPFDRSRIYARPEMHIANSDVIASHGNALGTLKPAEQYYLSSKGINDYKNLILQSLLHNDI